MMDYKPPPPQPPNSASSPFSFWLHSWQCVFVCFSTNHKGLSLIIIISCLNNHKHWRSQAFPFARRYFLRFHICTKWLPIIDSRNIELLKSRYLSQRDKSLTLSRLVSITLHVKISFLPPYTRGGWCSVLFCFAIRGITFLRLVVFVQPWVCQDVSTEN